MFLAVFHPGQTFCTQVYQKLLLWKVVTFLKRIKMVILFLIFYDQICPKLIKLDQTWSNLIKLNFPANLKMLLYKVVTFTERIKMAFLFLIFFIRSVKNGSNLIKLDQIGFPRQSKNVTIQSCHIYRKVTFTERIRMNVLFLNLLDQICPKCIKLDQTW